MTNTSENVETTQCDTHLLSIDVQLVVVVAARRIRLRSLDPEGGRDYPRGTSEVDP